jgi:ABC-type branched-subunit amino acid transport system ATPase component
MSRSFGGVHAVDGISLQIGGDGVVALVGPNGAGKTTLFNLVTGLERPSSGRVSFFGKDVTGWSPRRLVEVGLCRTFQSAVGFDSLTCADNVLVGMDCYLRGWGKGLRRRSGGYRSSAYRRAHDLLTLVGLDSVIDQRAADLPYGKRKLLDVASALATEPRLLLLDEPAAGLNWDETEELMGVLRSIHRSGVAVWVIEHDMGFVRNLASEVFVMNFGKLLVSGSPEAVLQDERVVTAYLGGHHGR